MSKKHKKAHRRGDRGMQGGQGAGGPMYQGQYGQYGQYGMGGMGYGHLLVSNPTASKNNLPDGMTIPVNSSQYHELSFHLWKKKAMVIDLVMAAQ